MQNLVTGVHSGFEYKLEIVGVGYRAQVQGKNSIYHWDFSPSGICYSRGVAIETPSQTEIVIQV